VQFLREFTRNLRNKAALCFYPKNINVYKVLTLISGWGWGGKFKKTIEDLIFSWVNFPLFRFWEGLSIFPMANATDHLSTRYELNRVPEQIGTEIQDFPGLKLI